MIAVYEAWHALATNLMPYVDKVRKVTIVSRGRAMGYTMQLPNNNRYVLGEKELESRITVLVSGRATEAMAFGEASTGAMDDLAHATDLTCKMVREFGMSPILGPVRLAMDIQTDYLSQQLSLDARVSPETATLIEFSLIG